MKKMDFDTYCLLDDFYDEHVNDSFESFRDFRKSCGIDRDTIIPCEYATFMLKWRKAEYNPADYGCDGKFSEVTERIMMAVKKDKAVRWIEYSAHKAGRRDMSYGRKAVEKKTGGGDWLMSYNYSEPEQIVNEYSRKTSTIHWEVKKLNIDITCSWAELIEYLSHYRRAKNGPEMGAAYWFKKYTKESDDGDRWIVEIQNYTGSESKIEYIQNCPYNAKK